MPTVDSSPQQEEWIDTFLSADAVFTYSDWGAGVLKEQASGKINYVGTASPGVDLDIFKPKNRAAIKHKFNLPEDSIIIGSVMRNQKRKLIPELLLAFKEVLKTLKEESADDIAKNLFLYLHTSYPDMGWEIPELLRQTGLSHKVLFSYLCKNCGDVSCSVFSGPQKVCSKCLSKASSFPSVTEGVTSETLSEIYNIFELYIQYSICEGFGMPQVEAGACGVPIATVNYSAMCDIIEKLKAYPIKIQTTFKELETKALRVYPDNNDIAKYIIKHIKTPKPILEQKRQEIAELTKINYNWDNISKVWEDYLDSLDNKNYRANWLGGSYLGLNPKPQANNGSSNFDNMLRICNNDLRDPSKIGTYKMLELLKNADYGFSQSGPTSISAFSFDNAYDYIESGVNNNNAAQEAKDRNIEFDEDFINYAHLKNKTQ
jgi:glycosyltransferase involved in cell wall biosynthesis